MKKHQFESDAKPSARQRVKKVAGVAVSVLLWAVLALSLLLVVFSVLSRLKNDKGVGLFGLGLYQIVSGSMAPELKVGDVLLGKRPEYKNLRVGQNLIFYDQSREMIITHKIIGIGEDFVTTHGIANPNGANEIVFKADVLAVQVFKIPALGLVLNFLRTPAGFIVFIVLPIGALILTQGICLKRQLKQYKAVNAAQRGKAEQCKTEIDELKQTLKKGQREKPAKTDDSEKTEPPDDGKA